MSFMESISGGLSAAGEAIGDFASSDVGQIVIAGAVAGVAAKALSDGDILSKDVVGGVLGGMAVYGLSKIVMGDDSNTELKTVENAKENQKTEATSVSASHVDGSDGFIAGIVSGIKKVAGGAKTIMLGDEQTVEGQVKQSGGVLGFMKENPELMKVAGGMLSGAMTQKREEELFRKKREQEMFHDATHGINKTFNAGDIKHGPLMQDRLLASQRLQGDSNQALANIRSRIPYPYQ